MSEKIRPGGGYRDTCSFQMATISTTKTIFAIGTLRDGLLTAPKLSLCGRFRSALVIGRIGRIGPIRPIWPIWRMRSGGSFTRPGWRTLTPL